MSSPSHKVPAIETIRHATALRIPELDGIRGLAMVLVLAWHYLAGRVQTTIGSPMAYAMKLLSLTWAGVDLFFVLSGFLIGGILMDNRNASGFYRTFYLRRFCRIFPLYYLMLSIFATALMFGVASRSGGLEWLFGGAFPLWTYASYLQNFSIAFSGEMGPHWMGITWSLAIEEQFYLILPLMVRLIPPRWLPWVLLVLSASAPAIRAAFYFVHPAAGVPGYVLLPARWDALFLGVLGAWALRQDRARGWLAARKSWLSVVLAATGIVIFGLLAKSQSIASPGMTFGGYTVLALFSLALILSALFSPAGSLARFLRNSMLVWVGTVSYGIYLFHQPISGILHAGLRGQAPRITGAVDAAVTLLSLVVTLALAAFSWRWFERPIVRLGQRVAYEP